MKGRASKKDEGWSLDEEEQEILLRFFTIYLAELSIFILFLSLRYMP